MLKRILLVAALFLSAVLVPAAFAVEGDRGFHYAEAHEMPVLNEVLIRLVVASLNKDPSGNTLIDAKNCAGQPGRRGCATPRHFLEAYRQNPELKGRVKLDDFDDLVTFMRGLKKMDRPAGTYEVASLRPDPKGSAGYRVVMDGVKRAFEPDEDAWVYEYEVKMPDGRVIKTQVVVVTSKCANPVKQIVRTTIPVIGPFQKPCGYIPFYVANPMSLVRFGGGGPRSLTDEECIAVRKVGETEFTRGWRNECKTSDCTLKGAFAFLGKDEQLVGSYVADVGWHELRVPVHFAQNGSPFVTILCLEEVGGPVLSFAAFQQQWESYRTQYRAQSWFSYGTAIGWQEYRVREERTEARVWYAEKDVPIGQPPLFWHWDKADVRQRITAAEQQEQAR